MQAKTLLGQLTSVALTAFLGAAHLPASSISVQSDNSYSSTHAVRLVVSRSCEEGDLTVPDGELSTDPTQEPSNEVDIVAGSVHFEAGGSIELGNGFSVASGAVFSAEVGARVLGAAYLRDQTPEAEPVYFVRFYLDPDDLTLTEASHQFELLVAYDAQGNREFVLGVTYNTAQAERRLWAEAYESGGTPRTTKGLCELVLGSGWHGVEAQWRASTGTGGDLVVIVDDQFVQSLASCLSLGSGLDNGDGEISAVEWGCRAPSSSSLGSVDLDDFDSRSNGPIGSP
jgi:hypothetical protein